MNSELPRNPEIIFGGGSFALTIARAVALGNPQLQAGVLLQSKYVAAARSGDFSHFFGEAYGGLPSNVAVFPNEDFGNLQPENLKLFFSAYPAQTTRAALQKLANENPKAFENCLLCIGSKGMELASGKLMHEVAREVIPEMRGRIAILVGPNKAADIWNNGNATVTIASNNRETGEGISKYFAQSKLIHTALSVEMYGLDLAGVVKNVHSLAMGMVEGMQLPPSTRFSLMQRCLVELTRLAAACNCDKTAVALGISGDYGLAAGGFTRNPQAGKHFTEYGEFPKGKLAEGVASLPSILKLARERNVRMPIAEMTAAIILKIIQPEDAKAALTRDGRSSIANPEYLIEKITQYVEKYLAEAV